MLGQRHARAPQNPRVTRSLGGRQAPQSASGWPERRSGAQKEKPPAVPRPTGACRPAWRQTPKPLIPPKRFSNFRRVFVCAFLSHHSLLPLFYPCWSFARKQDTVGERDAIARPLGNSGCLNRSVCRKNRGPCSPAALPKGCHVPLWPSHSHGKEHPMRDGISVQRQTMPLSLTTKKGDRERKTC